MMLYFNCFVAAICVVILETRGLDTPANATCYCLTEELAALRNPVHMEATILDGQNVFLIAEQLGVIRVYNPSDSDNKLSTYIDLTDRVVSEPTLFEERGILGVALHPQFVTNKTLFIYSIRAVNGRDYAVISKITDKKLVQEKILLLVEQPGNRNNGGQLLFGQDGYLYVFIGDGEPAGDQRNDAQNADTLLGKVLRLDVNQETVYDYRLRYYDIPTDNPKRTGWRPEIFAIGVRNMWRCSVDRGETNGNKKGRIFCGDLGSNIADEINLIQSGGNYGWHYREGFQCVNTTMCGGIDDEVLPIYAFNRTASQAVTAVVGGPVYRGAMFPELYGQLIFGDFTTGGTYSLQETETGNGSIWTPNTFPQCDSQRCGCHARAHRRTHLLTFGQTTDDELFLLMTDVPNPSSPRGALLKLVHPDKSDHVTCGTNQVVSRYWTLCSFLLLYNISIHLFM